MTTVASLVLPLCLSSLAFDPEPAAGRPFVIQVVDDATNRGVPLVELKTVNEVRYVTDSQGIVAFDEPALMDQPVFFHVKSHGYEFPADGFGYHGKALTPIAGKSETLKIHRINIAERLYRMTGEGIYRDSVRAGRPTPTRRPLLNGRVFGSDSVLMVPYRGKLHWFWGDTNKPGYPLGNFHTPGATSEPPGQGGLDPDLGVDLTYFVDDSGFAKPTARFPGDGPTWLGGLATFRDSTGTEQMVAAYSKIKPPMDTYERGLALFDSGKNAFEKKTTFPLDSAIFPSGHTFHQVEGDTDWIYYSTPFPLTRVRARWEDLADITRHEAFTCLETGSRLKDAKIDRGPDGRARYAWRVNTPPVGPSEQAKLLREGKLKDDEALIGFRDVETSKTILAHGGTVHWNAYRKRWVAIVLEAFGGPSFLGEIWYAEADHPLGPWAYARKVVSHQKYSFYNPKHHVEFDQEGGRRIYFEGTYTASFSGNTDLTPRYDYNQVMYRLDLADSRLNLPVAVYAKEDTLTMGVEAAKGRTPAFYALERPDTGTTPVTIAGLTFHAFPVDAKDAPKATVVLWECTSNDGQAHLWTTDPPPPGFRRAERPACLVWKAPVHVVLP